MIKWLKSLFNRQQQHKCDEPELQPAPEWLCEGVRVRINNRSAFSKGSTGIVKFIQPRGSRNARAWVLRDGASSAAWFWPWELEPEPLTFG